MRVLVTGGGGTVATYIPPFFRKDHLLLTTHQTMDITKKDRVNKVFEKFRPDLVIHLAAATNVDLCEKNPKYAEETNSEGSKNVARASKNAGATLLYLSTSAVFDGKKKFYIETDSPNPVNQYGRTKLMGEKAIEETLKNYFIVRCGWIIGGGPKEKKFLSHILRQVREGKKEIMAVSDLFGSISYGRELGSFIKEITKSKDFGIHHYSSAGVCSRFELAQHFVKILGSDAKVKPVLSTTFAQAFFAPRPKYEVVRSIKKQYDSSWKQSVEEYVRSEIKKI